MFFLHEMLTSIISTKKFNLIEVSELSRARTSDKQSSHYFFRQIDYIELFYLPEGFREIISKFAHVNILKGKICLVHREDMFKFEFVNIDSMWVSLI